MSSYITFWVKNKKGNVTPLASFSRSTEIYQKGMSIGLRGRHETSPEIGGTTYAIPYTTNDSVELISLLKESINTSERAINALQDNISLVLKTTDSLEDKMDYITSYKSDIDEYKEQIERCNCYINYLNFIEIIREEQDNYDNTKEIDDTILVGIDAVVEGEENVE